ncbi:MAG: hypothetical protein Q4F65_06745 [Propionibacteriaceae bacterium]|nr:hypothetical protein [Propionibacteriaceae bacterium]
MGRQESALTDHAVAAAWGFAEATVFFIVPDVWTSRVALRRPGRALAATLSATAGAVLGGALGHAVASRVDPARTAAWAVRIPAIGSAMVERVDVEVAESGYRALLVGPTKGIPYKLYARAAGVQGLPMGALLVWTIPARMGRFVLVTGATGGLAALARRMGLGDERLARAVHTVGWAAFYAWYFRRFSRSG